MTHPFDKYKYNRFGFEVGQELEWFEWLHNYRASLKEYRNQLKNERFEDEEILKRFIAVKEELIQISQTIHTFASKIAFRPYHKAFLKSIKIDRAELLKFKTILLKNYEESESKDAKYYLSIIKS
jgi:hypothetical protein